MGNLPKRSALRDAATNVITVGAGVLIVLVAIIVPVVPLALLAFLIKKLFFQ